MSGEKTWAGMGSDGLESRVPALSAPVSFPHSFSHSAFPLDANRQIPFLFKLLRVGFQHSSVQGFGLTENPATVW